MIQTEINHAVDRRLHGRDLICFGSSDWGPPLMPVHHLAELWSTAMRVLYVEPPLASTAANYRNYWSRKLVGWLTGPHRVAKNLFVYNSPPGLPFKRSIRGLNKLTQTFVFASVARQMQRMEMKDPLICFTWPTQVDLLKFFPDNFKIYYVADELREIPYGRGSVANAMDSELSRSADLVVATSAPVFQRRRDLAKRIHLIPNGIDFQLFGNENKRKRKIPPDLEGIPRPIVGFSGAIDSRVDFSLLRFLAQRHRQCSFVLNGPARVSLKSLQHLSNFYYLGMKPVESLPNYIAAYDVCLIPYQLNEYTRALSPLKFWEYLSLGKPVVSTPISACLDYPEMIYIAGSHEEFSQALTEALEENNVERRGARIELAKGNTWESRMVQMSQLMADAIKERG